VAFGVRDVQRIIIIITTNPVGKLGVGGGGGDGDRPRTATPPDEKRARRLTVAENAIYSISYNAIFSPSFARNNIIIYGHLSLQ